MNRYLIVADDFTGANDTGVQLKRRGVPTSVVFSSEFIASEGSFVLDTESRALGPEEAAAAVRAGLQGVDLRAVGRVMKKVDATLRGSVAAEIKAVDQLYGSELVVFAVLLLFSYVQLAVISDQVVSLRSDLTGLKSEEAKLRAQYELAYDLESIEQTLTASGAMVKPQNGQVIYVDLSEPDSITYYQQEEGATGLKGAAESMYSIFSEIVEYFS